MRKYIELDLDKDAKKDLKKIAEVLDLDESLAAQVALVHYFKTCYLFRNDKGRKLIASLEDDLRRQIKKYRMKQLEQVISFEDTNM